MSDAAAFTATAPMLALETWQIGAGIVVVVFFGFLLWASRYVKVPPNAALIISGRGSQIGAHRYGFRIVRGGATFVWPVFEKVDRLSLELMTIDVKTPEVYTIHGVPVMVDGVAQVKVRGDDVSIGTAAEQFLDKSEADIMNVALQTLEGHLRAILGTMTVEEIYKNRDAFAARVQEVAATDLANMGLGIVSFTIRDIKDKSGYLDALGRPRTAQVRRDAVIGEAEANRDATIRSAEAERDGKTAKLLADTKIAEANRDYQMQLADYQASVNQRKAESDLAYDLQRFKTTQVVKKEEVQVQVVEKESQIAVQEQEIRRREKELEATVQRPADAERKRLQTIADGERYRLETEARGRAEAVRAQGLAEADIVKAKGLADADIVKARGLAEAEAERARGLAQAEVIRAQGEAEAEAMRKKAEAWREYGEAAIVQTIVEVLPQLAKHVAEPLSKIDKMVVVSTGGRGAGASKITQDVADIVASLPPVVEGLTGVDLQKLLSRFVNKGDGRGDGAAGAKPADVTDVKDAGKP
ncbi:MAG: Inner membrane protein YqiK [Planctomycetes bacterium]|nr:Inner membrane protein YqiK [Planctomycetota bacterium]